MLMLRQDLDRFVQIGTWICKLLYRTKEYLYEDTRVQSYFLTENQSLEKDAIILQIGRNIPLISVITYYTQTESATFPWSCSQRVPLQLHSPHLHGQISNFDWSDSKNMLREGKTKAKLPSKLMGEARRGKYLNYFTSRKIARDASVCVPINLEVAPSTMETSTYLQTSSKATA